MSNKQILVTIAYLLIFGGFGFAVGSDLTYEKQSKINNQLMIEYDELKTNYDNLEIECKWNLESCYQQMGDMEDDYDVNNDGVISMADYAVIKNYVLNRDKETN